MRGKRRVKRMIISLTPDRELWEEKLLSRISEADSNPNNSLNITEVLDEKERAEYQLIDPDVISDEDLFK